MNETDNKVIKFLLVTIITMLFILIGIAGLLIKAHNIKIVASVKVDNPAINFYNDPDIDDESDDEIPLWTDAESLIVEKDGNGWTFKELQSQHKPMASKTQKPVIQQVKRVVTVKK